MQATDDPTLLLHSVSADTQILLQTAIFILQPLDLIRESEVVLLESLKQLHDLRVIDLLGVLVEDLLLQLLVLLPQHLHVVLEQVDVLSHALHLLLVLIDSLLVLKSFSVHLPRDLVGIWLLIGGQVRLG